MANQNITIPNNWVPRAYQLPLWSYLEQGGLRAVAVWHRRGGKDSLALNWTAVAAHLRVGVYWHMLPTLKQGRKVIWDGIDKAGRRMIDQAFPEAIRKSTNNQEMRIELKNGSIWQVVGSDNYDSLVGANPVGVIMSEYSVADPAAWRFMSPILAENGGWAVFIYTPRGKNHGYKLFKIAAKSERWFAELLPLDKSGAYPLSIVEDEREDGMPEEMIQQEYFCSFDAAVVGAYYGKHIAAARNENRIGRVPWEPKLPVITGWDLGMDDATVIWFAQVAGKEIRMIDRLAAHGEGLEYYAKKLSEKPYTYSEHYLPHDVAVRELGTGRSRQEVLEGLLNQRITVVPRQSVEDGIQAVRTLLPRMYFDEEKTEVGFEALALYRSEYDESKRIYKPVHDDWTSHDADSMRTLAMGLREDLQPQKRQTSANTDYDPMNFGLPGKNRQAVAVDDFDYFA